MKQPLVTIYSRTGCHLCENAESLLTPLAANLDFALEIKLLDGDKELEDLYGQLIPVVHVNGKYFSHFRVDLEEFKSFLEKHRQRQ
ncbi:MAG: glutaredoxin family protein [Candidatus Nanopelagicaceae bacterium]